MSKIKFSIEGFLDRYAAAFLMSLGGLMAGAMAMVGG